MCIRNPSFDVEVMAFVDSQVECARRVSDLGLGEKMDSFVQGAKCFADFAFASDYISQGPNSELFSQNLVAPILGTVSRPLRPAIRRLFVESYTIAAADLKRVDPGVEVDFVHKIRLGVALIDCFEGRGLEGVFVAKVGLLRTPVEHVQEASGITHPFSTLSADDVKIAITKTLKMGPTAVEEMALHACAEGLEAREREPQRHAGGRGSRPCGQAVASPRRESGFPNADEGTQKIASGFDVVGALSPSGAFAPHPRTETSSIETLCLGAKATQPTVIDFMRPGGDDELDEAVTQATEDEVANGWPTCRWTQKQLL